MASPAEHKFCGHCGALLDAPGLQDAAAPWVASGAAGRPGEIKQVTVLFCDIVNSTALTERLGAEAMRDLVGSFIDASLAEVHRYEGSAPQFSGDGFMALFGAPLTQEDHVRRALLAALAIRRAVSGEGAEADGDRGLDLQIRIGIHSGPVVFGAIGGGFRIETAIGDTANVAARLEQAAEPGAILLSEAVRTLAQGYARTEPVGRLTLKGKSDLVSAHRLLGVARWRSARDAVAPARVTGFVGRDRELASLESLLPGVERGCGRVVGLVGDPGIGKSRLLGEFRRRACEGRRMTWIEGRCLSYGAAIPYSLALDLLRSHCDIVETDSAEAIVQKVGAGLRAAGMDAEQDSAVLLHLLGVKGGAGSPAPANPEAIKAKSFEVLQRLCVEGSRRRPLVLALEDLHWIDAISEELLGALARRVGDARILLLAAYRPEYRPAWADGLSMTEIPLPPLSRGDSLRIVGAVLNAEEIAEPLTEEIVARADGNPLFLEQLALHAGEAGGRRADVTVPQTIHGVVMARIDRLPEASKQLLQIAAVIGREFSLRLLRAVWRGRGVLETRLRELARLEFLDEWPDDDGTTYVFRHALTQETTYASLLERERRRRHGDIGHSLEQLYCGRTDEVAELLALHFGRSDETDKAVDFAILAGEKATRGWANSDALASFEHALSRLRVMPDSEANRMRRIDAVLKQAEVKFALGQHAEHIRALNEIREIVEDCNDLRRRAAWHYWVGFLHILTGSPPDVATHHCNEARALAAAVGSDEIKAIAESCLAHVHTVAGRLREAVEAGEHALTSFEARESLWWAGRTLWSLSVAANCLGRWDESLDYCRRALDHGLALNDPRLVAVSWLRMGSAYIQRGDLKRGSECCNKALALAPPPYDAAMVRAARAYADIKSGSVENGIAGLSEVLAWSKHSNLSYTRLHQALWLAEGLLRRCELARARVVIEDVLNTSRTAGYIHFEGRALWLMGECLAREAVEVADEWVGAAIYIFEGVGARNDLAKAMVTRAAVRQRGGDRDGARRLLGQASAIFEALGTLDEPARVNAAVVALERGSQIPLLES
jgi:class 3 adenylate cyclase/tetratricopeptide (TPR) repeat protein